MLLVSEYSINAADFVVTLNGTTRSIANLKLSLTGDGVNAALVELSAGFYEGASIADTFTFVRGSPATISANGRQIFQGYVDDVVPGNMSAGTFNLQVSLLGRLSHLASGTLQSNSLTPKCFDDLAISPFGQYNGESLYQLRTNSVGSELWPELARLLTQIATDTRAVPSSVTSEIQSLFGSSTNQLAATLLGEIEGTLVWNASARQIATNVALVLNQLMLQNWYYDAFLNKIINIGQLLRYSIIELNDKLIVTPYLPFFPSSEAAALLPSTYSTSSTSLQNYVQYSGCLITNGGARTTKASEDLVVGSYKMSSVSTAVGPAVGRVHVAPAPPVLSTLGGQDPFTPLGQQAKTFTPVAGRTLGDCYAKILCWEQNYERRTYQVSFPYIKTDISPLTPVRVRLPPLPGASDAADGSSIYGSVRRVTIAADASRGFAATSFEIGFVRSESQQQTIDSDWTGHPIWTDTWRGADIFGQRR